MKKILLMFVMASLVFVSCKKEVKKESKDVKPQETKIEKSKVAIAKFNISGMTCPTGCAKMIESKLAKKAGVTEAAIVFEDSIATVKFDKSKTTKKEIMTFVNGLVDGKTYKTCDKKFRDKKSSECSPECKKECNSKKTACVSGCENCTSKTKESCSTKKSACTSGNKKECCSKA